MANREHNDIVQKLGIKDHDQYLWFWL